MIAHRRRARALGVIAAATALASCGGVGVEAPPTPAVGGDHLACPTGEEALENTRVAVDEGRFDRLTPHIERILVTDRGLRLLVPRLGDLLEQMPLTSLLSLADGFESGLGLARMKPHLRQVLRYIDGTSEFVPGAHYGPVDVMHRVVQDEGAFCDTTATLGAFRRVLLLRVAGENGERVPWIEPAFDAIVEVARDPEFVALLERVELDDDQGGGGIAVGRDSFVLLARLVTANIAADNFDLAALRELLDDVLTLQLDPDSPARAKLSAALDQLEVLVDPSNDIFPHVQGLVRCVNDIDEDGAVPTMLFDYLSIEDLSLVQFLEDVDAMGADPAGESLRALLEDGLEILEGDEDLSRDLIGVGSRFLAPEVTRDAVPAVLALEGQGVLTELTLFLRRLLTGCDDEDAGTAALVDGGGA